MSARSTSHACEKSQATEKGGSGAGERARRGNKRGQECAVSGEGASSSHLVETWRDAQQPFKVVDEPLDAQDHVLAP